MITPTGQQLNFCSDACSLNTLSDNPNLQTTLTKKQGSGSRILTTPSEVVDGKLPKQE